MKIKDGNKNKIEMEIKDENKNGNKKIETK